MSKFSISLILLTAVAGLSFIGYKNFHPTNPELEAMKAKYTRSDEVVYPLRNPYSEAKYELGRMLFFDTRLSDTNAISCATCHNPAFNWTDSHTNSKGKKHEFVARKSMSIINLAWDDLFLWNSAEKSLEGQVREALKAPRGMSNEKLPKLFKELHNIPGYKKLFREAFENERKEYAKNGYINLKSIQAAIATFERGLISSKAPFDKWIDGDENAISERAKRGFVIFNTKGNCASCHTGWRFSDGKYYNIGIKEKTKKIDIGAGRMNLKDPSKIATFKAVGLRNIDQRPPYMHNGSIRTLEKVIESYNKGGIAKRKNTSIKPLKLTKKEKKDLLEFLKTLTSKNPEATIPYLPPSIR